MTSTQYAFYNCRTLFSESTRSYLLYFSAHTTVFRLLFVIPKCRICENPKTNDMTNMICFGEENTSVTEALESIKLMGKKLTWFSLSKHYIWFHCS